jgi:hypothetical protein
MIKTSKSITTLLYFMLILPGGVLQVFGQTKAAKKPVHSPANGGLKLRIRTTMESQSYESTQYVKGARERNEMSIGKGLVNLTQCDLKRAVQINDTAKTYLVQPFGAGAATPNTQADTGNHRPSAANPQPKRGGVVSHTTTLTDTGERKEMFGFIARHIKTSMISESSPDACYQQKIRMESDGWYIDLPFAAGCPQQVSTASYNAYNQNQCQDEYRVKNIGSGKLGFPLDVTTTMFSADDQKTVMKREVLELSRATLDDALFELPAGYTEAKDYQQLMGIQATSMPSGDSGGDAPPANSKTRDNRSSARSANADQANIFKFSLAQKSLR